MIPYTLRKIKKLYLYLYDRSPLAVKSALTKSVLFFLNKPFVKNCKIPSDKRFPNNYKGCMVISADFEMAAGSTIQSMLDKYLQTEL